MPDRRKRRVPPKGEVRGYLAVNKLMNRAIGKVLTKAHSRDKASAWGKANRKRQNDTVKRWKDNHREKHLEQCKEYNRTHLKEAVAYQKERRKNDPAFTIKGRMRARMLEAIHQAGKGTKADKTFALIGCTPKQLVAHLENDGNINGMDVDHIFPISRYNIETDQKRFMHWTNTQLLTPVENRSKSGRLPTKAMAAKVDRSCWPDGVTEDMLPDIYPDWSSPLQM
jgi:hypothetical protein